MRNSTTKLILFIVAFAIGTLAVILSWQANSSSSKIQSPIRYLEVKNSDINNIVAIPYTETAEQLSSQFDISSLQSSLSFTSKPQGCGNLLAYKSTDDKTKVIAIRIEKDSLNLNQIPRVFEIKDNKNIQVFIYDFGKDEYEGYEELCFDAIRTLKPIKLIASSGKAIISISNETEFSGYNATIIMENITFRIPNNNFTLKKVEIENARVGWLPG